MNIKRKIQRFLGKLVGMNGVESRITAIENDYKEKISTLHYFLNTFVDIKSLPPTKDRDLRIMQLCNLQLLRIIDKICVKHSISYWLDFGTLLGAVRHGGFIPWDDDMDISVLREDYDRLLTILPIELAEYGIQSNEDSFRIGVGYNHLKTGIWLDIFATDFYLSNNEITEIESDVLLKANKLRSVVLSQKNRISEEKVIELKQSIFNLPGKGKNKLFFTSPELLAPNIKRHTEDSLFPLQRITFEGFMFFAPNNVDVFLKHIYGDSYMGFPKSGVLHHDLGRGPLSTWAKRSGTNMEEVYTYLKGIADSLE